MNKCTIELQKAIRLARGSRNFRVFSDDCGVSATSLCQLENGKTFPSRGTIEKITAEKACPQNGISYDYLMKLAGYIPANINTDDDLQIEETNAKRKTSVKDCDTNARKEARLFQQQAFAFCERHMIEQNMAFAREKTLISNERSLLNNRFISFSERSYLLYNCDKYCKIHVCAMKYLSCGDIFSLAGTHKIKYDSERRWDYNARFFCKIFLMDLVNDMRIPDNTVINSIIVDDKVAYETIVANLRTELLRANISLIYFDKEEDAIIEETVLSSCDLDKPFKGWTNIY